MSDKPRSFQEIILRLQTYWAAQGCAILQPYDMDEDNSTTATTAKHPVYVRDLITLVSEHPCRYR